MQTYLSKEKVFLGNSVAIRKLIYMFFAYEDHNNKKWKIEIIKHSLYVCLLDFFCLSFDCVGDDQHIKFETQEYYQAGRVNPNPINTIAAFSEDNDGRRKYIIKNWTNWFNLSN